MTNKPDISPYRYFEDMEEGVEYVAVEASNGLPIGCYIYTLAGGRHVKTSRNGNISKSSYPASELRFIPRYTPPKPVNSWDIYTNEHGNFYLGGGLWLQKQVIKSLAEDPKVHAAFNDLIESKRNKGG